MQSQPSRAWKLETYHFTQGPKSQVTWGQSVQSQPSRAWKLGSYHFTRGPKPQVLSHLRSICAISIVESMKVGTYHFTWGPKSSSQVTWGHSVQSQLSRAWKLGLTTSHGVPSPHPKSLEVNPCNLNRWGHGSWDLPLHTGLKSQVTWGQSVQSQPSRAWKLGTYHFTRGPKSQVTWGQSVQSQPSRAWKLGTYHFTRGPKTQDPSPNYDMDAYMTTLFGGEAWDLCCEMGRAKS